MAAHHDVQRKLVMLQLRYHPATKADSGQKLNAERARKFAHEAGIEDTALHAKLLERRNIEVPCWLYADGRVIPAFPHGYLVQFEDEHFSFDGEQFRFTLPPEQEEPSPVEVAQRWTVFQAVTTRWRNELPPGWRRTEDGTEYRIDRGLFYGTCRQRGVLMHDGLYHALWEPLADYYDLALEADEAGTDAARKQILDKYEMEPRHDPQ